MTRIVPCANKAVSRLYCLAGVYLLMIVVWVAEEISLVDPGLLVFAKAIFVVSRVG